MSVTFLALFIALLYWQAVDGRFVWDDRTYFIDNDVLPHLGPLDLKDIFLRPSNFWGELLPVRDWLYVVEYTLFGLTPSGYHVTSILLYILIAVVLYEFLARFCKATGQSEDGKYVSVLITTLLFAASPLHVEAVAYISGQKDLLFSLFSLLSMLMFWRYFSEPAGGKGILVSAVLSYYLAVLSKLTALMLVVMIPVLWFLSDAQTRPPARRAAAGWVLVSIPVILWFAYRMHIHGQYWGTMSLLSAAPFQHRVVRAFRIIGAHTLLALKPYPQSFGYPFDDSGSLDINFWTGLISFAGFLLMLSVARKNRVVLFGAAVYLVFLFPVLQIFVSLNNAAVYDRYLFLPVLGLIILIERCVAYLVLKRSMQKVYIGILSSLIVVCSVLTFLYIPAFHSDVESTRHSYEHYPDWPSSAFNYVYALIEAGELDKAHEITLKEPTFSRPAWVRGYFRGWILLEQGRPEAAIGELGGAAWNARAGGYFPFPNIPLARALIQTGRVERARTLLREVVRSPIYQPLEVYRARKMLDALG